jgi:hypothetical protein
MPRSVLSFGSLSQKYSFDTFSKVLFWWPRLLSMLRSVLSFGSHSQKYSFDTFSKVLFWWPRLLSMLRSVLSFGSLSQKYSTFRLSYSKCSRALTFENLWQGRRIPLFVARLRLPVSSVSVHKMRMDTDMRCTNSPTNTTGVRSPVSSFRTRCRHLLYPSTSRLSSICQGLEQPRATFLPPW